MAKILILSQTGKGIPLALRLAKEGHTVNIFIKDEKLKATLQGFRNPKPYLKVPWEEDYNLILADETGLGELVEKCKKKSPTLGGGIFHDKLENDIEYTGRVISSLSAMHLTSPVDPLIDINTQGWFNGERFILPFIHSFNQTRLMEGDKGPLTAGMGDTLFISLGDRLTNHLLPLEPLLTKVNYKGPLTIHCALADGGVYFKKFQTSLGEDTMYAFAELLKIPLYTLFQGIIEGRKDLIEGTEYINQTVISTRLTMPPYPLMDKAERWRGQKVLLIDEGAEKHIWLQDVRREDNTLVLAGTTGIIGCVTARGNYIRECQRRVRRTITNIVISPDVQYREDIGTKAIEDKETFERWCDGY